MQLYALACHSMIHLFQIPILLSHANLCKYIVNIADNFRADRYVICMQLACKQHAIACKKKTIARKCFYKNYFCMHMCMHMHAKKKLKKNAKLPYRSKKNIVFVKNKSVC